MFSKAKDLARKMHRCETEGLKTTSYQGWGLILQIFISSGELMSVNILCWIRKLHPQLTANLSQVAEETAGKHKKLLLRNVEPSQPAGMARSARELLGELWLPQRVLNFMAGLWSHSSPFFSHLFGLNWSQKNYNLFLLWWQFML